MFGYITIERLIRNDIGYMVFNLRSDPMIIFTRVFF